jgi:hypothetical protein
MLESRVFEVILQSGILGAVCLLLVLFLRTLYNTNQKLVKEREDLHKQYQDKLVTQLVTYSDRYVTKSGRSGGGSSDVSG